MIDVRDDGDVAKLSLAGVLRVHLGGRLPRPSEPVTRASRFAGSHAEHFVAHEVLALVHHRRMQSPAPLDDSLLHKLFALSEIVPETAELAVVDRLRARHVNLSFAKLTSAAQDPAHAKIVDDAVKWAQNSLKKGQNRKLAAGLAAERLAIEFAQAFAERIPGRVSIEIDGRLAHQRRQVIEKARELVRSLAELGIAKERILVKLPATFECIEAAATLRQKSEIRTHMTLVFGLHQVAACADAGVDVVSPAVGRINDFHKKNERGGAEDANLPDPGVSAAWAMRDYVRTHGYETLVMPGTFRSANQALALAGFELLTLPPALIDELALRHEQLTAALDKDAPPSTQPSKLTLDGAGFAAMHAADALATSKLEDGVRNLSWAAVTQQQQLTDWITKRQDAAAETGTLALFGIWDFDGDGFIDREEWNGTDKVFAALDKDGNGRVSVEELAAGLGAPYRPKD
ncbi:MAG: hypothetical protein EXR75_12280 [Myxococcales bacterium]|nr:hypothetical protein [Myxococcales bacterium]